MCRSKVRTSRSTTGIKRVVLYSKPDCHLCDRAKEVLQRCRVEFEVVDISGNPELETRYGRDIPVILLDGKEVARHFVRERKLLELLNKP